MQFSLVIRFTRCRGSKLGGGCIVMIFLFLTIGSKSRSFAFLRLKIFRFHVYPMGVLSKLKGSWMSELAKTYRIVKVNEHNIVFPIDGATNDMWLKSVYIVRCREVLVIVFLLKIEITEFTFPRWCCLTLFVANIYCCASMCTLNTTCLYKHRFIFAQLQCMGTLGQWSNWQNFFVCNNFDRRVSGILV